MNTARAIRLAAVAAVSVAASAATAQPHAHGNATLDVAVDARAVSIRLSTPLDNLVGFERPPRDDQERKLADAAVARLRAGETLFRIDPAAGCRLGRVELESAALRLGASAADDRQGHADLDATYVFSCAAAGRAKFIEVELFEFKRLHRLDVQLAAPSGQWKRELRRSSKRLPLVK